MRLEFSQFRSEVETMPEPPEAVQGLKCPVTEMLHGHFDDRGVKCNHRSDLAQGECIVGWVIVGCSTIGGHGMGSKPRGRGAVTCI